jgi:hypothetical protein
LGLSLSGLSSVEASTIQINSNSGSQHFPTELVNSNTVQTGLTRIASYRSSRGMSSSRSYRSTRSYRPSSPSSNYRYRSSTRSSGSFWKYAGAFGAGAFLGHLFHPFGGYYGGYHYGFSFFGLLIDIIMILIIIRLVKWIFGNKRRNY